MNLILINQKNEVSQIVSRKYILLDINCFTSTILLEINLSLTKLNPFTLVGFLHVKSCSVCVRL